MCLTTCDPGLTKQAAGSSLYALLLVTEVKAQPTCFIELFNEGVHILHSQVEGVSCAEQLCHTEDGTALSLSLPAQCRQKPGRLCLQPRQVLVPCIAAAGFRSALDRPSLGALRRSHPLATPAAAALEVGGITTGQAFIPHALLHQLHCILGIIL